MSHIYILKIVTFLIAICTLFVNFINVIHSYIFNKPLFVHFYLVKKRVSKRQKEFLVNGVSYYDKLNTRERVYFEHRLAVFIRKYEFVSRDGLNITPEVKVLIGASYIKLTFGMRTYITSAFDKIVVYPSNFYSLITKQYHKGEYNPVFKMIVFSWEDFLLGDIITNDNLNLGIHEFVHALSFHSHKAKDISAKIFLKGYKKLSKYIDSEEELNVIRNLNYFRDYAFENKMEFVAVMIEYFFESPNELRQQFPDLFADVKRMLNYKSISNY